MRTFLLPLALLLTLITAAQAQNPFRLTDEQKEQMLSSGTREYGWSGAETAFARMQEAFLNCAMNFIIREHRSIKSQVKSDKEMITIGKAEGHFSATIVEYNDNGKEAEIEMIFDSSGEDYYFELLDYSYDNNHHWERISTTTITGKDGIQIKHTEKNTNKDNQSQSEVSIISSAQYTT